MSHESDHSISGYTWPGWQKPACSENLRFSCGDPNIYNFGSIDRVEPAYDCPGLRALIPAWCPLCRRAEILLDRKDPKEVIWDEFIVIPFIFWPIAAEITEPLTQSTFIWIGAGFLLFRFFDISKPLIIHHSQRLPGGWGVMVDDLLAALASSVILWLAKTFSLSFVG